MILSFSCSPMSMSTNMNGFFSSHTFISDISEMFYLLFFYSIRSSSSIRKGYGGSFGTNNCLRSEFFHFYTSCSFNSCPADFFMTESLFTKFSTFFRFICLSSVMSFLYSALGTLPSFLHLSMYCFSLIDYKLRSIALF